MSSSGTGSEGAASGSYHTLTPSSGASRDSGLSRAASRLSLRFESPAAASFSASRSMSCTAPLSAASWCGGSSRGGHNTRHRRPTAANSIFWHNGSGVVVVLSLQVLTRSSDLTPDLLATLIASGLDPEVCTIFIQSHVPYHAQLNWLLECVTTYGELSRMTAFKEKSQRQEGYRVGLLTYPVLQAADILLYDTEEVPVGDDQRQHLELARTIAERFNNRFGETFRVPVSTQPKVAARVMDLQEPTRKMSKSISSPLGNLHMFDTPEVIRKKISKAVTDTDGELRFDWEKKPGLSNLLEIYSSLSGETPQQVAGRYTRYGELKTDLSELVIATFAPMKERYDELLRAPDELYKIAADGALKASEAAGGVYRRAAKAMGLTSIG